VDRLRGRDGIRKGRCAIDQASQDIYVASNGNEAVYKFNPKGEPIEPNPLVSGVANHLNIAVDNDPTSASAGDLYVPDGGGHLVEKFTSAGVFVCKLNMEEAACPGKAPAAFSAAAESPEAVAVDPSTGYVYVSDTGNNVIDVFSDSGEYVNQITAADSLPLQGPRDLKVDSNGDVYVATQGTSVAYAVVKFTPSSEPVTGITTWTESVLSEAGNATAIAINSHNDVYVEVNEVGITEYGPAAEVLTEFGQGSEGFGSGGSTTFGMAVNDTTGDVYVSNINKSEVFIYVPLSGELPEEPLTDPASGITSTTAVLHGELNPLKAEKDGYRFAYTVGKIGEGEACNGPGSTMTPPQPEAEFGEKEPVEAKITELEPNTEYKFCLIAKNKFGSNPGVEEPPKNEKSFKTAEVESPTEVETGAAVEVTALSAKLTGKLNPGGSAKDYFEYSTEPCGLNTCGTKTGEAGPLKGNSSQEVAPIKVIGLIPGTEYHYWLVATNAKSTVHGEERTFTTEANVLTEVETGPAEAVTATSARLGGNLNPGGSATYRIEYGPATCAIAEELLVWWFCAEKTASAGPVAGVTRQTVAPIEVTGLTPNTTYRYWIVGANTKGVERGEEMEFKTKVVEKEEPKQEHKQEPKKEPEKEPEHKPTPLSIAIAQVKVAASSVSITVNTSQAGTVTISGPGLKKTVVSIAAGSHKVKVPLTKAGRASRKHKKKIKVKASLKVGQTTVSASKAVVLPAKKK
jgi:hypothetical protein